MLIGAVAHPYLRPLELNLLRLGKKVRAGAQFLLTQAVFDLAGLGEGLRLPFAIRVRLRSSAADFFLQALSPLRLCG